jgi:hypothetical protein
VNTSQIARLPYSLEIDGVTHIKVFAAEHSVIYENYSKRGGSDCVFHTYAIERQGAAEELGQLIGSFSNLNAAIDAAAKEHTCGLSSKER